MCLDGRIRIVNEALIPCVNAFAFLGPESTGKTSAAIRYCELHHAIYVEEYAREYLKDIKLGYTEDDILKIAKHQIQLEKLALQNYPEKTIVFDTELITIQIWLEFYNYTVPSWIINHIESSDYRYYLFDTDIPWVADGLRNNPHDRLRILNQFMTKLSFYKKDYQVIKNLAILDIV